MFKQKKHRALELNEGFAWEPSDDYPLCYLEARRQPRSSRPQSDDHLGRAGYVLDSEVQDWLQERGRFANRWDSQQEGTLRLLMCERTKFRPKVFCMSEDSFKAMDKTFNLPEEMFAAFEDDGGIYLDSSRMSEDKLESFQFAVKLPQMFQLGNYGLALSHNFSSGNTNAFLWGWNVIRDKDHVTRKTVEPFHLKVEELVGWMNEFCTHPLLLPVILLREHVDRAKMFLGTELSRTATELERRLGAVNTGRLFQRGLDEPPFDYDSVMKMMADAGKRADMTSKLNTNSSNAINLRSKVQWSRRYCAHLCKLLDRMDTNRQNNQGGESEMRKTLEYLDKSAEGAEDFANHIVERMELQLTVFYNFVTQADSDLNARMAHMSARIAADTALDSVSMKALALVTVIFLPPSFIASMFSMSMFDWRANSSDLVSTNYWIFWVSSVPLTIFVVALWRLWFNRQKDNKNKYFESLIGGEKDSTFSSELLQRGNHPPRKNDNV